MDNSIYYTRKTKWGKIRSDRPPTAIRVRCVILAVICFFVAIFMCFFTLEMVSSDYYDLGVGTIFLLVTIVVCYLCLGVFFAVGYKRLPIEHQKLCDGVKRERAKEAAFRKTHPNFEDEEFYKELRSIKITSLDSEANIARALLYARNKGLNLTKNELIKRFETGKRDVEQHEKQKELNALKAEEEKQVKTISRYARLTGLNKTLRMIEDLRKECQEIISECEAQERSIQQSGHLYYTANKAKEGNWALFGGIASGIAGGAAGLATAMEIQHQNDEIRNQNRELSKAVAQENVYYLNKIWEIKYSVLSKLERLDKANECAKMLLTKFPNQKKLLAMIDPVVKNIQNSPTGAVKVTVELHPAKDLIIYDNVEAVVDGSIQVILNKGGECVGTAMCVIELGGLQKTQVCTCISTKITQQVDTYEVEFAPNHLCVLEKAKF